MLPRAFSFPRYAALYALCAALYARLRLLRRSLRLAAGAKRCEDRARGREPLSSSHDAEADAECRSGLSAGPARGEDADSAQRYAGRSPARDRAGGGTRANGGERTPSPCHPWRAPRARLPSRALPPGPCPLPLAGAAAGPSSSVRRRAGSLTRWAGNLQHRPQRVAALGAKRLDEPALDEAAAQRHASRASGSETSPRSHSMLIAWETSVLGVSSAAMACSRWGWPRVFTLASREEEPLSRPPSWGRAACPSLWALPPVRSS